VVILYSSILFSIFLAVGVSVTTTRLLGPQLFGDFKFLYRIFNFVLIFSTFGLFISGGRLLAQKKHDRLRPQLTGALLVCAVGISLLFTLLLFGFSFFQDTIFNNKLGYYIRMLSPLLFVFPFQVCLQRTLTGDNRIREISFKKVASPALYLIAVIIYNYFVPLSLASALVLKFLSGAVILLGVIIWIKPKFKNIKNNILLIVQENKTNGFPVYIGLLFGVATASLGEISIGYYMDNIHVGFFALAMTLTAPLGMIPNVVGTTFFKDFANRKSIPLKVNLATLLLTCFALLLFIVFIKYIFLFLYSKDYAPTLPLVYYLAVSTTLHGMGDYFTRFLGAHGRGKEMRNRAIIVGIVNVAGAYFLVKYFGMMGAVATKLISSTIYMVLCYAIYHNLARTLQNK